MASAYEAGKAALDRLLLWVDAHAPAISARNESTTRFHLIDTLVDQCLQWPREQIETEHAQQATYTDYIIGKPVRRFVLEAKREGIYFELPAGSGSGTHRIADLVDGVGGKALREAMAQVAGYCAIRGVPVAAVCNGHQIVAFLAVRTDGIPPLEGRALVFPSLTSMQDDFRTLWDNLSRPGVEARRLHITLNDATVQAPPEPLSARIAGYPGYKRRNELQTSLEILGQLFIEDLTRAEELRDDFLSSCYATSGALSQYAMVSKQILQSRYAVLEQDAAGFEVDSATTKRGLNENIKSDLLASAISKRPIVLLGDVGAGKTMFIQHLINIDAPDIFEHAVTLYIDFGRQPRLAGDLGSFVADETVRQLADSHQIDVLDRAFVQAVYNRELNRFDRGIYGELKDIDEEAYRRQKIQYLATLTTDMSHHLERSLQHIYSSTRRQIVVFLDNIDQRSSDFQERVFLISESLADGWPATVFISLRPDTFYASRRDGVLTAYQTRVFTISPPRVDTVVKRRLEFARRHLAETSSLLSLPAGTRIESPSLDAYLSILADNFENNDKLVRLIDNLAGGNIRLALDFLASFIGSGHVNTRKILEAHRRTGTYTIPVHEFLRALMFGDREYFDPDTSPIANIFGISRPDGREHFLAAILIAFAHTAGEAGGGEGLISTEELFAHAQSIGFDEDQIAKAISRAVAGRLLEASPRQLESSAAQHFRVTTVGVYTTRVLAALFTYVDAVVVDTPIVDEFYTGRIADAKNINDRISRAHYFRLYLDKQWAALSKAGGLSFDWKIVSENLVKDIEAVTERAARETPG